MKKTILLSVVISLFAFQASASIAIFSDGRNMKISAYRVDEDSDHQTLASGGVMSMPVSRLERIVDDEVVTPEVVEEVKKIAVDGVFPRRSWRYSDDRRPLFNSRYDKIIVEAAKHFDVDATLVSAVIKAE